MSACSDVPSTDASVTSRTRPAIRPARIPNVSTAVAPAMRRQGAAVNSIPIGA